MFPQKWCKTSRNGCVIQAKEQDGKGKTVGLEEKEREFMQR